ncbi:MAG: M48 family metallopeptidase [Paramuribaculum sp.]
MKTISTRLFAIAALLFATSFAASAQFNLGRVIQGAVKTTKALTLSDKDLAEYASQAVAQMDKTNTVLPEDSPYTQRLRRLTVGLKEADGIPLNFKVYQTSEVNAFACPDGSVRVYTGIMDLLDDNELLGVIGHEIGHVMKHHSRKAMKNELLQGALADAIASADGRLAALTDSQLGELGRAFGSAKYSRKQESEADNCGYDFLVDNGRNPWGMVMAFEKMQALESQGGSSQTYLQKMFSDHPDTAARIKKMKKRCEKDGYTRP